MIRDITLGQYYNADSVIHRLDPRTKLFISVIFLVDLFLTKNPLYFTLLGVLLILYIGLSRVPISFILRGLKPVWILLAFSFLMNLFERTGTPVVTVGPIAVTDTGIRNGCFVVLRMIMMILGTSIMTYTTQPTDLTDGMEQGLGWMRHLGVPVHDIAMMLSIALRFIPVLIEELNRVMQAQTSRGASLDEGSIMERIKALVPICIPLFVSATRRADALAVAMESRCYQGGGRTKLHPLKRSIPDYIAYAIMWIVFFTGVFVMFHAFSA